MKNYIFFRLRLQILRPSETAKERRGEKEAQVIEQHLVQVLQVDDFELVLHVDKADLGLHERESENVERRTTKSSWS